MEFGLSSQVNVKLRLNLVFEITSTEPNTPSTLAFEGKGDHGKVVFRNWQNPLGTCLVDPVQIGQTNSRQPLFFMAASWLIGVTRIVDVQLMAGGAK
jgi:hypothetical protein